MRLLYDQDDLVARWYAEQTGIPFIPAHAAIGIIDDQGAIIGAALLQIHNPHSGSLDLLSTAPSLAGIVPQILRWAFHFCYRLEATTSRDNKKMKRHLPKLGFTYEAVVKHMYGKGHHGVRYYMTRDECRWTNGQFIRGRERLQPATAAESVETAGQASPQAN